MRWRLIPPAVNTAAAMLYYTSNRLNDFQVSEAKVQFGRGRVRKPHSRRCISEHDPPSAAHTRLNRNNHPSLPCPSITKQTLIKLHATRAA